jgi:hypothetical protein
LIDLRGRVARESRCDPASGLEVGGRLVVGFVFEALVAPRRRQRWGAHREVHAGEDRRRGLGRVDRCEDAHLSAVAGTLEHVDREDAFHQLAIAGIVIAWNVFGPIFRRAFWIAVGLLYPGSGSG